MATAEARDAAAAGLAHARTALAGNPSDGYGGATLAVTIDAFVAHAALVPEGRSGRSIPLLDATVRRFDRELGRDSRGLALTWRTSIPQCVGLGGSSAIVIAALRALCTHHGVELAPDRLAALALAVETEELGIVAGLQDRVAQAYGGLTFMEFDRSRTGDGPRYEQLDPGLLPPLAVAWRTDGDRRPSGVVHGDLRARFDRRERRVVRAMRVLGDAARQARDALLRADTTAFAECVDATFELRASILVLDRDDLALVSRAREAGAAANYTGSGGAIVAVCRDDRHREAVLASLGGAPACDAIAVALASDLSA